jgi:hypothetical protein
MEEEEWDGDWERVGKGYEWWERGGNEGNWIGPVIFVGKGTSGMALFLRELEISARKLDWEYVWGNWMVMEKCE